MASSHKTGPTPIDVESKRTTAAAGGGGGDKFPVINVVLRLLLLACAVVAVAVMATSKQTEPVAIPFPPFQVPVKASFTYSPAFVYFIVALSVTALYAIISTILSIVNRSSSSKLLAHFVIFDVLLLGIVAAATGTAGGVGYIGLKGNSHSRWGKVCNIYDSYCRHIGASVALSLIASMILVLLILLSLRSLSKRIPK